MECYFLAWVFFFVIYMVLILVGYSRKVRVITLGYGEKCS